MAISQTRYVDITSGVGAGSPSLTRDLILRLFTSNPLVPTGEVVTFSNATDVGTYFNTTSTEYLRAVFYFGWVSKNITTPQAISFYNYNADTATASLIFGSPAVYLLSTFTAISAGNLTLTMGGFTHTLSSINLSGDASLAAVATTLTGVIQAYSAGGAAWTGAVVTYDATRGCFDLVSGATGVDTIAVTASSSPDVAPALGWLTGAIFSNGSAAQTAVACFTASAALDNNFGSFAFVPTLSSAYILAVAEYNYTLNIEFLYTIPVSAANASAYSAMLLNIGDCCLTLAPLSTEYPEQVPAMILAATDYTAINSVQNYMFQQFNLTPSVTTDANANLYDGLLINYYGQTQEAGTLVSFYQTGVMYGLSTDPRDLNVFANEMWLKDAISAQLMALLLSVAKVSANASGKAQVVTILQAVINQALINGTISVGKPLDPLQQLYITNASGSATAWQQVQNSGYWLGVAIQSYVVDSLTQYKIVYTLIYSKDDDIRFIQGTDILI